MKTLLIVATLAFVAVQLIRAAPAPEDDKKEGKEAVVAAPAGGVHDVVPSKPEAKAEVVAVTQNQESPSAPLSAQPTEGAEKAQ